MSAKKYVQCIDNSIWELELTIGKVYEVLWEDKDHYKVLLDTGRKNTPFKSRFLDVSPMPIEQLYSYIQINEETRNDLKNALTKISVYYADDIVELVNDDKYEQIGKLSNSIINIKKVLAQL